MCDLLSYSSWTLLSSCIIFYHIGHIVDITFYRILSNIFYHLLSAIFYYLHLRSSSIIFCLLHIFCHLFSSSIFYHVASSSIIFCYHIYIYIYIHILIYICIYIYIIIRIHFSWHIFRSTPPFSNHTLCLQLWTAWYPPRTGKQELALEAGRASERIVQHVPGPRSPRALNVLAGGQALKTLLSLATSKRSQRIVLLSSEFVTYRDEQWQIQPNYRCQGLVTSLVQPLHRSISW